MTGATANGPRFEARSYTPRGIVAGVLVGIILLSAGVVTVSGWMAGVGRALSVAAGVVLAAVGVAVFRMAYSGTPPVLLTIDDRGIRDALGVGLIPWDDVTDVWIAEDSRGRVLCIGVPDTERYARRVSWGRRLELRISNRRSRPMVSISFSNLDRSLADAAEFLRAHHLHRIKEPPPHRPAQPMEPRRWEIR